MTYDTPAAREFEAFLTIVRRLRKECPWDREQTHESMRSAFIEETYEAVDAIDAGDWPALAEELGDVLLNVVFQAILAEEEQRFEISEVIRRESEKLVHRHPHVFGDAVANDADEVLRQWERTKKRSSDRKSVLDGVPRHLPSLLFAERTQAKAARVGFDFPSAEDAWVKVEEEISELRRMDPSDVDGWSDELGDIFFALVNVARLNGVSAEMALRATNDKFGRRFRFVESRLETEGRSPADATLEEMDRYWEEAKRVGSH